jgi:hypothetical protein
MHHRVPVLILFGVLAIGASFLYISQLVPQNPITPSPVETPSIRVALSSLNGSEESGAAILTETPDGNTRVVISLSGGPENISQPAHIHSGSCTSLGPVRYPLTSAMNGVSETVIGASFADLRAGRFALNIHRSVEEVNVNAACGGLEF